MSATDAPAAAIDLGAQCALLLVARRGADGALDVLEDHALHPRLGARATADGALDPDAVERTLEVLSTYARRMDLAGVPNERRRLVVTSPLRRARDAATFTAQVHAATGLVARVISAAEEARLARRGVLGADDDGFVLDVGGGSTQCSGPDGRLWTAELGATVAAACADGEALERLARAAFEAWPDGAARGRELWLVGGSAGNLACLVRAAESYDPRLVDGTPVDAAAARAAAKRLRELGPEGALDLPIEPARAGVLAAGLVLIAVALERLAPSGVRVSSRGLRHALVEEALSGAAGRGRGRTYPLR